MKVGLEIHQQLDTGKLFCGCRAELREEVLGAFVRELHATSGEGGVLDEAARVQTAKKTRYRYQVTPNSCLVEADEEPPHPINPEALRVALTMAELLSAQAPEEAIVMRKIVVDGSNTAGFQRTVVIAMDGEITVNGKRHGISTICLEEDAARKIAEEEGEITYRLDRLGIPLIEIATAPDIEDGREAREVAESIGMLLRSTRKVKRGIGTIREDLNVSIEGGARVEIKGVQELGLIEDYVANEVHRQGTLLERRNALRSRGAEVASGHVDLGPVLGGSPSKILATGRKPGGAVLGLKLPGFAGLLGSKTKEEERLGREFADHARAAGVSGILHSDELPGYGVTDMEVSAIRRALSADPATDGFVLVASPSRVRALAAIEAIRRRALVALEGLPEETRDPLPDGRTRYSRPLPGRHRMYPETDLPPSLIDLKLLKSVRSNLPERPEETLRRLGTLGLSAEQSMQLLRGGDVDTFDMLVLRGIPHNLAVRVLTQELPALEREAQRPLFEGAAMVPDIIEPALRAVERGTFSKEGLLPVLRGTLVDGLTLEAAVSKAGLSGMTPRELEELIQKILDQNEKLLAERGMGALGPLMGDVMGQVRGRRDGKEVSETLQRLLRGRLGSSA